MEKLDTCVQKIARGVKDAYQKIEDGVVSGYRRVETGAVEGFERVTDRCVETLFAREGESVAEARERLAAMQNERSNEE